MRSLLRVVLLILSFGGLASCLAVVAAASASSASSYYLNHPGPKIACIISTNKNGGHSSVYAFGSSTSDTSTTNETTSTTNPTPATAKFQRLPASHSRLLQGIQSGLRSTFLPSGYPSKTPQGYLQYAAWSWVQDLSTQLRSVLATQRILEGVGVGREGATALSALLNFLLRDGCGMAATLLFTSLAASKFRCDVKRWRLFADIMVDVGMTLEVAAVSVPPHYFLPMICAGNMCKAICGVAAGACGGAINLHWAQGSDISDVNAKFAAQNTVTGSLGLIFAALLARSLSDVGTQPLWLVYGALTALHIIANRRCMRLLAFGYLNTVRMRLVVAEFFRNGYPSYAAGLLMPTPKVVSQQEPLLFLPTKEARKTRHRVPIQMGVPFGDFVESSQWTETDLKTGLAQDPSYLVAIGSDKSSKKQPRKDKLRIVVALMADATPLQHTKAYFHALLLKRRLGESPVKSSPDASQRRLLEGQTAMEVDEAWKSFAKDCKRSGWDLRRSELCHQGYEVTVQYRKT